MEIKLDKNQRTAAILTILISIKVVVLLLTLYLKPPFPPKELPGMEVNLGYSITGGGEIQPVQEAVQTPKRPQNQETEPDNVVTQDVSDVHVNKQNTKVTKTEPVTEPEPDPEPEPDQRYMFDPNKISSQGGSEGPDNTIGDKGNPQGVPGADNYHGNGGTGNNWQLDGRQAKAMPKPEKGFKESGKVTVKIYVNRAGRVTSAIVQMKGTNTTSKDLHDRAVKTALQASFHPKSDAPEVQVGTITYNFVIN